MFILLNGSFGIGKSTVAEALTRDLPGAALHDPERLGFVLRRLPAWMLGRAEQPDDYQDLRLWRDLTAWGARRRHRRASIVVVPMAFTNRAYFDGLAAALGADAPVWRLCLVAPLDVVRERLRRRAHSEGTAVSEFQIRRSAECVAAHKDPAFGLPIDATAAPAEIVAWIRAIVGV